MATTRSGRAGSLPKAKAPLPGFRGRWLLAVALLFAIESLAMIAMAGVRLPASAAANLSTAYNTTEANITNSTLPQAALTIYSHNLVIGTIDMIPGIGVVWFALATSLTGLTVSAISGSLGLPGPTLMAALFLSPHTWLELPSYAVGTTAGIYMLIAILRRNARKELWRFVGAWFAMSLMLLFAAVVESSEIKLAMVNPLYAILLWIPVLLVLIIFISVLLLRRRKN